MLSSGYQTVNIIQGEFHVSDRETDVLTTILGSCVAACIYDPVRKIGGINHFLLPGTDPRDGQNIKYGAYAMEQLINALLRRGAQRSRLEAKLFGGARVVKTLSNIGQNNAEFGRQFLRDEGIPIVAESLGGMHGRRVRFWPTTGRAQILTLDSTFTDPVKPAAIKQRPVPVAPSAGEVDLF